MAANTLIILIQRATGLLGRQLKRLEKDFIQDGGFKEKMYQARIQARQDPDAPTCPECQGAMRKRNSSRGTFWGCANYPACKGLRPMETAV